MYIFYIDDSADGHLFTFSALGVQAERWKEFQRMVSALRTKLKVDYGIYIRKELHATKFLSGRGIPSTRHLSKIQRAEIFNECLDWISTLGAMDILLFNVATDNQNQSFERLLNRINRTMQPDVKNDLAMLICDEGKEWEYTKIVRKMGRHNPIPSRYGGWGSRSTRNIVLDRIIEDPLFKQSFRSTIIQLVDFCAYALLRQERPIPSKTALGLDRSFRRLDAVCFKPASPRDPQGIIR